MLVDVGGKRKYFAIREELRAMMVRSSIPLVRSFLPKFRMDPELIYECKPLTTLVERHGYGDGASAESTIAKSLWSLS